VAQQRPRQSRRPSAAKSIIRAEVPKDTDPIYLQASFFCAAAAGQRLYPLDLFARPGRRAGDPGRCGGVLRGMGRRLAISLWWPLGHLPFGPGLGSERLRGAILYLPLDYIIFILNTLIFAIE
jgi:hypothetical protein